MNILFTNDWHFAKANPGSRIDDYNGELLGFLRQILYLVRHFNVGAVCIAGDIFHNKGLAPWSVLIKLLEWGQQIRQHAHLFAIMGNHDQQHDRYESIDATPYGVLVGSGIFEDISRRAIKVGDSGPTIYGVPWPDGADPAAFKNLPENVDIVLAHGFATPEGQERWGVYCHKYESLAVQAPQVKVWHFGHDHSDHGVFRLKNGAQIINIGALARGALDQDSIMRQVKTAVLSLPQPPDPVFAPPRWQDVRADQCTITCYTLKQRPAEEIFDMERYKSRKAEQAHLDQYLDGLQQGLSDVVDVDYEKVLQSMTLDQPVRAKVQEYISRAEAAV